VGIILNFASQNAEFVIEFPDFWPGAQEILFPIGPKGPIKSGL
jgi:hypothetical protein